VTDTPSSPPVKRLRRSLSDRVFAGVCGGLAEYLGVSAIAIRVVWTILVLFGGTGLLAYLIAWIIVPSEPGQARGKPPSSGAGRLILGALLILAGALIMAREWFWPMFGFFEDFWRYALPVGLILLGLVIAFFRPSRKPSPVEPPHAANDPKAPPPPPAGVPPGLRRSRRDKFLFGICGGLAEKWQVDSALVRVGFAAAILLTEGFGLLIYIILLAVIPLEPENQGGAGSRIV